VNWSFNNPTVTAALRPLPWSAVLKWTPLEGEALADPFLAWSCAQITERFGLPAFLLGCFLCLASGVPNSHRAVGLKMSDDDLWTKVVEYHRSFSKMTPEEFEARFPPGPRALAAAAAGTSCASASDDDDDDETSSASD